MREERAGQFATDERRSPVGRLCEPAFPLSTAPSPPRRSPLHQAQDRRRTRNEASSVAASRLSRRSQAKGDGRGRPRSRTSATVTGQRAPPTSAPTATAADAKCKTIRLGMASPKFKSNEEKREQEKKEWNKTCREAPGLLVTRSFRDVLNIRARGAAPAEQPAARESVFQRAKRRSCK